jgi:hypothetical protein
MDERMSMTRWWNNADKESHKLSEINLPSVTLSTMIPTRTGLRLNSGLYGARPVLILLRIYSVVELKI